jgi:hypothetical protein
MRRSVDLEMARLGSHIQAYKSEMRISKSETNPNLPNTNVQNGMSADHRGFGAIASSHFGYLHFGFVASFGFGSSDFGFQSGFVT